MLSTTIRSTNTSNRSRKQLVSCKIKTILVYGSPWHQLYTKRFGSFITITCGVCISSSRGISVDVLFPGWSGVSCSLCLWQRTSWPTTVSGFALQFPVCGGLHWFGYYPSIYENLKIDHKKYMEHVRSEYDYTLLHCLVINLLMIL